MIEAVKFYQNIIQNSVENIILLSKNGEIEYMNQSASDFFQWSFSEDNKRNILEYCYQTKGIMRTYLKQLANSRFEEVIEIKIPITRIGMKKSETNIKGIYDTKRKIILLTLELEKANKEMQEIISFHRAYSVVGLNKEFQIIEWNETSEKYFGYKTNEILGKSIKLLVPDNRLEEYQIITKLLENNGSLKNYETFRCHKNQTLIPVTVYSSPVHDKDGKAKGYITIFKERNYETSLSDTKIRGEDISYHKAEKTVKGEEIGNKRIDERGVFFGKTILGIDKNPIFQNVLEYILEDKGCKYIQAYSGTSALFILEQEKVDLILLELKLCDMDSNEFAERMKSMKMYKNIPIIIVTEYPQVFDSYCNPSVNIKKIISKPIQMKEFCEIIKKYI